MSTMEVLTLLILITNIVGVILSNSNNKKK